MNKLNENNENGGKQTPGASKTAEDYDFAYVPTTARIAQYDDLRSAPRITEIHPAETTIYIENLASKIYEQAKIAGGSIPYTVIREVSENFIHARFREIVVSILDDGNTIRFADQGPGISNKEKAQLPGFSSAIEPMKNYIRGVGSGLPIVREYLGFSRGSITIEDNLGTGSVVTISMVSQQEKPEPAATGEDRWHARESSGTRIPGEANRGRRGYDPFADERAPQTYGEITGTGGMDQRRAHARVSRGQALAPHLSAREQQFLPILLSEGELGVTELSNLTEVPPSSTFVVLQKLEEAGLIAKVGHKRILTDLGYEVAQSL